MVTVKAQEQFRILIVDDEPGIRKILRMFLEMESGVDSSFLQTEAWQKLRERA